MTKSIANRTIFNLSILIFSLEIMICLSIRLFYHTETVADIQFHARIFISVFMVIWMNTLLLCCRSMLSFGCLCSHILCLICIGRILLLLGHLYMCCPYTFAGRSIIWIIIITNFYIISHFIIFITDWVITFNIIISPIFSVLVLFLLPIILPILVRSVISIIEVFIFSVGILTFILKIVLLRWSSLRRLILSTEFKCYIYIRTIILLYFYQIISFLLTVIRPSSRGYIINCSIFMFDRSWRFYY